MDKGIRRVKRMKWTKSRGTAVKAEANKGHGMCPIHLLSSRSVLYCRTVLIIFLVFPSALGAKRYQTSHSYPQFHMLDPRPDPIHFNYKSNTIDHLIARPCHNSAFPCHRLCSFSILRQRLQTITILPLSSIPAPSSLPPSAPVHLRRLTWDPCPGESLPLPQTANTKNY